MTPDEQQIHRRARLLPEEQAVGSDDAEAQAEAVLTESEIRTNVPDAAPDTHLEHRRSADTVSTPD
jgi:phage protein D